MPTSESRTPGVTQFVTGMMRTGGSPRGRGRQCHLLPHGTPQKETPRPTDSPQPPNVDGPTCPPPLVRGGQNTRNLEMEKTTKKDVNSRPDVEGAGPAGSVDIPRSYKPCGCLPGAGRVPRPKKTGKKHPPRLGPSPHPCLPPAPGYPAALLAYTTKTYMPNNEMQQHCLLMHQTGR